MGPTGGYLIVFMLASCILGELVERREGWTLLHVAGAMALGVLAIYLPGAIQLALVLGLDVGQAVTMGVLPFLVGDAIKVLLASGIGSMFLRPSP